jgi:hypothetical protein
MWSFEYHSSGRIKSATDFSGRKTTFSFSGAHLDWVQFPGSISNPSGKLFQFAYFSGTGNGLVDG